MTVGNQSVKRKCQVQGQPGWFNLIRLNSAMAKVQPILGDGQFGPEEDVDPVQVFDVRVLPNLSKVKASKPEAVIPVDHPERRLCSLKADPGKRFHLLRKQGADLKVLEVGTSGTGHWVSDTDVEEIWDVPNPDRPKYVWHAPVTIGEVSGREGTYLVLRKTAKGARVVGPLPPGYFGETIPVDQVLNERKIDTKGKTKKKKGDTEGGEVLDDTQGEPTPVEMSAAPAAEAPVAPAPQVAPGSPAQAPRPAAPGPQVAQAARPQTVTAGVAPRPQPGQQVGAPPARPQAMPARPQGVPQGAR